VSSIRIESSAFGDDRFEMLARKAGLADADHARGKMARLWRTCTIEQRHILSTEEVEIVLGDRGPSALIASRLGEEARGGIRICGTKGRIEWLGKLKENGKKGGRPAKTKRFPSGFENETKSEPSGFQDRNPLSPSPSLAPVLSPAPAQENPEREPSPSAPAAPQGPPALALVPQEAPVKVARKALSKPLPAGWKPSPAHEALAIELAVSAPAEAEKMRDWATAKGERKADWDAAFRGWLRRASESRAGPRGSPSPPRDPRVGYSPARPDSHTTPDGIVRTLTEL
jgi:hypothetical protein